MTPSIAIMIFLTSDAAAWECVTNPPCGCDWADNSQLTYRINVSDFNASGQAEIELAGDAWDAGYSEINRGANWDFVRGQDITSDGAVGDFTNQIYKKPTSWFTDQGLPAASLAGVRHTHLLCGRNDSDIIFNSDFDWTTQLASETTPVPLPGGDPASIGQVAMHEFGHVLGLAHENDVLATMNESYPNAGEVAGTRHRIGEDDFVGLVAGKSNNSFGTNLLLSKFRRYAASGIEVWDEFDSGEWCGSPGATLASGDGPHGVVAMITGTTTTPCTIEWRLSSDTSCTTNDPLIATRSVTLGVDVPANDVRPIGGYSIPINMNYGDYHLCAMIRPQGPVAETATNDNSVVSERMFEVAGLCW
ncbi:MAG: matrixin family metalloprotease [Myxococcales bacterium]|nr:matrixin family metalloprotease [Myxococcales bacterium]